MKAQIELLKVEFPDRDAGWNQYGILYSVESDKEKVDNFCAATNCIQWE
jgi:hypothetical protein